MERIESNQTKYQVSSSRPSGPLIYVPTFPKTLLQTRAFGSLWKNIMKNGTFAPGEQMFHFQNYWNVKKYFSGKYLKIWIIYRNDAMF